MYVPLLETHRNSAVALIRQRAGWLEQPWLGAHSMATLEQRLRIHLHVLSNVLDDDDAEPGQFHDTAVWLAARLQSKHAEQRQNAAESAANWLIEKDSPAAKGACWVLALYRTNETDEVTKRLYHAQPKLRSTLIYIWDSQGVPVPQALLNQGELRSFDPELQAAVLRFASNRPATGLDVFRHYYSPLLSSVDRLPCSTPLLTAAIWGGLLRGDGDAVVVLRRVIELQTQHDELRPLLRLAALSGDPGFHPVLRQHARSAPESGYWLLALWGHRNAIPDVVSGLHDPRTSQHAAEAWYWLSGIRLPMKPRLSVVGDEQKSADNNEVGEVADLRAAKSWWRANDTLWPDGIRRVLGEVMTPVTLSKLAGEHAGKQSQDLLDLLALQVRKPLGVTAGSWFSQRLDALQQFQSLPEHQKNLTESSNIGQRGHA